MKLNSKYCTIIHDDIDQLNRVYDRLKVKGCHLLVQKIDKLTERVQHLLGAKRTKLQYNLKLLKNQDEVKAKWFEFYGTNKDVPAFYSNSRGTIYAAENKIKNRVLAHEISHVILCKHFVPFMTGTVQEVICQWVETEYNKRS